ncbi:hypothetical protein [Deinococcus peraridilitoris]|uniref:Uncharacterized protein n=1 Tax=Deinococcus peraridilitoris (strain DSM 19664 / LMG 22246 / CIP 109416 / KR-200) TaxID=937777 RepID=L0A0K0_DEIPD|nr:hypothetical protein [Deinococcus peraridilitoris]AFZ66984.1 hypothetical protein Deipe_1443 [Deinococcus peraridilitoris DSM 19664]
MAKQKPKNVRFAGEAEAHLPGVGVLQPGTVYAREELPEGLTTEAGEFTNANFAWTEEAVTPQSQRFSVETSPETAGIPTESGEQ